MTKEDRQLIAIEIDKYFRMRTIDAGWFSSHIKLDIKRPDDGFEPQRMTKIKINQDSIKTIQDEVYGFRGNATVLFNDKASNVGCYAEVEFNGKAYTITAPDRTSVKDVLLTGFHRTTDIIPQD